MKARSMPVAPTSGGGPASDQGLRARGAAQPWLSDNTNIAEIAALIPSVAARKRTTPGVLVDVTYDLATFGGPPQYLSDRIDPLDPTSVLRPLVVDGEDHTGDWSITDFTPAELKAWIGGTTHDAKDQRPADLNGQYPVLTKASTREPSHRPYDRPPDQESILNNAQASPTVVTPRAPAIRSRDAVVKLIEDNGLNTLATRRFSCRASTQRA